MKPAPLRMLWVLLTLTTLISCKQIPIVRDIMSVQEMQKVAQAGDVNSQYRLGMLYMGGGDAVPQNYALAAEWFKKAAEAGHDDAQFMWGSALYSGVGVEKDHAKAVRWFLKSAKSGHKRSQYQLGDAYLNGRGVKKDRAWGARWYGMSASQGHKNAQFTLGVLFTKGIGVPGNRQEAVTWFRLAENNGDKLATELLKKLHAKMTSAEYRLGLAKAKRWRAVKKLTGYNNRPTVRYVQYVLGKLGYDAGYADGIRGEQTDQAIAAYLNVHNVQNSHLKRAVTLLRKESPRF